VSWEGVLVRATIDDLRSIAHAATDLAAQCTETKSLALNCINHPQWPNVWILGWQGFRRNRAVRLTAISPQHQEAIGKLSGVIGEECVGSGDLELAGLVARVVGRAAWICSADGLCESAFILFEHNRITASLCTDADTHPSAYGTAAIEGIQKFMPDIEYEDDLFDALYGSEAEVQIYTFIESGVRCVPPRLRD
jgi:hypothetical protein